MPDPIDPALWSRPELQPVLLSQDIGALYRALNEAGVAQRRIAELTGTTQPQVADIMTGRRARVMAYDVLARNADGLGIPRERMGLSFWGPHGRWYGPAGTYPGGVPAAHTPKGVTTKMLRRHLIAFGGIILAGAPVDKVGELLEDLGQLPRCHYRPGSAPHTSRRYGTSPANSAWVTPTVPTRCSTMLPCGSLSSWTCPARSR